MSDPARRKTDDLDDGPRKRRGEENADGTVARVPALKRPLNDLTPFFFPLLSPKGCCGPGYSQPNDPFIHPSTAVGRSKEEKASA